MSGEPIAVVDRPSVRACPPGLPIMHQRWGSLLFVHWPVPAELLRPLIPEPLVVDTHEGLAWVGITRFTMWGVRPAFAPPLPFLSESQGQPSPEGKPLLHQQGEPLRVRVWPKKRVR